MKIVHLKTVIATYIGEEDAEGNVTPFKQPIVFETHKLSPTSLADGLEKIIAERARIEAKAVPQHGARPDQPQPEADK